MKGLRFDESGQLRPRGLLYHARTLFLFTKSDFKTVMLPQSLFALSIAIAHVRTTSADNKFLASILPIASRIPHMLTWLWLHLLAEDIANQRHPDAIQEDAVNKPWRPLPSSRLSPKEASAWLRAVVLVTLTAGTSLTLHNDPTPTLAFLVAVWLYNDLGAADCGPLVRNSVNVMGLSCLGWGALETLGLDIMQEPAIFRWWCLMAMAIMTTIHAQDLPDMAGDLVRGRLSAPLVWGEGLTRWSIAVFAVLWSVVCPWYCRVMMPVVWAAVVGIGAGLAGLALGSRSEKMSKVLWKGWCVWMMVLYSLPMFGNLEVVTA